MRVVRKRSTISRSSRAKSPALCTEWSGIAWSRNQRNEFLTGRTGRPADLGAAPLLGFVVRYRVEAQNLEHRTPVRIRNGPPDLFAITQSLGHPVQMFAWFAKHLTLGHVVHYQRIRVFQHRADS